MPLTFNLIISYKKIRLEVLVFLFATKVSLKNKVFQCHSICSFQTHGNNWFSIKTLFQ